MRNRILTLISILAAVSFSAAAQPPERFIQVDSVIITHQPLEFEIRHRILPTLEKMDFRNFSIVDSLYLRVHTDFSSSTETPVILTIVIEDSYAYPFAGYCLWDPDYWHKPVGYCRIQGYLFFFYNRGNTPPQKFISPVPWKHRTLEYKGYIPIADDARHWDFLLYDYAIITLGNNVE